MINPNTLYPTGPMLIFLAALLSGCGSSGSSSSNPSSSSTENSSGNADAVDIYNAIFEARSADCADYATTYDANVLDIQRSQAFALDVVITANTDDCRLASNNIPNHNFNDYSADFKFNVAKVDQIFSINRYPVFANVPKALQQNTYDAVMLNGVPVDMLSAGCYDPNTGANTLIGCTTNDPWLLDPMGPVSFGTDMHNAHTQPDGSYHYHASPKSMFDDYPGPAGSPVIGFAADGFPLYGKYFYDGLNGTVRKAVSGYTLKDGARPLTADSPGGDYDGSYIDDYVWTDAGDLDQCNGQTVEGQYGYYVTDAYPWIIACHQGEPDDSFFKNACNPQENYASCGFPGKPVNEPIVIVLTGQSNATGSNVSTLSAMPTNNKVFDWQTTIAAPTAATQTGTWTWKIADPNWDSGFDVVGGNSVGFVTFTGMRGGIGATGPAGNIGWSAANQLQQETGRTVYMITVDQWGPVTVGGGGGNRTELNTQVNAALALIPDGSGGTGLSKADLVIWMQGESDSGPVGPDFTQGKTPEDYWTRWSAFKTNAELTYANADSTRWLVCGIPKYWPETYGDWAGLVQIAQRTNQYVNFIPSNGVDGEDTAHYSGAGLLELGARVSKAVLSGVTPKPL